MTQREKKDKKSKHSKESRNHKKDQDSVDKKTKKRKRESEERGEEQDVVRDVKKHKKDRHVNKKSLERRKGEEREQQEEHDTVPAPKKHKKDRDSSDKTSKKQKRDEQREVKEQDIAPDSQPAERPMKKSKKGQKDSSVSTTDSTTAKTTTKQHKDTESSTAKPTKPRNPLLDAHSPFVMQTTSFNLPLSPCAYKFPVAGLCAEHISPLLLSYYPPLKGILLSYSNPRLSEQPQEGVHISDTKQTTPVLSLSREEYAVSFVWLAADFLTFQPKKGTYLEGRVSMQNESMLGLVCYNYFNAAIERDKLPKDWKWVDSEDGDAQVPVKGRGMNLRGLGHYVDGKGEMIGGSLVFKVDDFDTSGEDEEGGGTITILGTLLFEGDKP